MTTRTTDAATRLRGRTGRRSLVGLLVAGTLSGCGPVGPLQVEVGTGVLAFVPFGAEGVRMSCGPQGGQHIWLAVRTLNGGSRIRRLTVAAVDRAGRTACTLDLSDLPYDETDGETRTIAALTCMVDDVDAADGQPHDLTARVVDDFGREGVASASVVVHAPDPPCY